MKRRQILFTHSIIHAITCSVGQVLANENIRKYDFHIVKDFLKMDLDFPSSSEQKNNSTYDSDGWFFQQAFPEYLAVAGVRENLNENEIDNASGSSSSSLSLMGPAIHVQEGDRLVVNVTNFLDTSGMSIHWHGFEMPSALQYDGVVGITQCPIDIRGGSFVYDFVVEEDPGTYWYHHHAGVIQDSVYDGIRGPLIVHPKQSNTSSDETEYYKKILENERILLLSDGFRIHDNHASFYSIGGLQSPVSKSEDGWSVGTHPWSYGTCNGKYRDVINVKQGTTVKLRLINAGSVFAFSFSIDEFELKVVASDSSQVVPMVVDEVVLSSSERFDVEVTIPSDIPNGSTFWIRADTLESRSLGYQNGIRAVLHVSDELSDSNFSDKDIPNPNINPFRRHKENPRILNCYSNTAYNTKGTCYPLTALSQKTLDNENSRKLDSTQSESEVHVIDQSFQSRPQFAHFSAIDGGKYYQHVNPKRSMLLPDFDAKQELHPNTAMLNLEAYSTAILIWRHDTLMDHPIHVHGYKLEILEIAEVENKQKDCTHVKCKLNTSFSSKEKIEKLKATPYNKAVLKDSFVVPAGGAVATRITTHEPALWFVHCHIGFHREDGMGLIMNVGNYTGPEDGSWLPIDYPSCDTPFLQATKHDYPACECYRNKDVVMENYLTENHQCSRDYLCYHSLETTKDLPKEYKPKYSGGIASHASLGIPGWGFSIIVIVCVIIGCFLTVIIHHLFTSKKSDIEEANVDESDRSWYSDETESESDLSKMSFFQQVRILFISEWVEYRPYCINVFRFAEVIWLGLITGFIFSEVGSITSNAGIRQSISLLFFSLTLWTFNRMYPATLSFNLWREKVIEDTTDKIYSLEAACIARLLVYLLAEGWWPYIFAFICLPMGGIVGTVRSFLLVPTFLFLNLECYIALGCLLGVALKKAPWGMIMGTLISQATILCAGFYTTPPRLIEFLRYASPIYHAFKGILKVSFRWEDSYDCMGGDVNLGVNQCFLEFSASIDDLKLRGINVATYNDELSRTVWPEALSLVAIYTIYQTMIYISLLAWKRVKKRENKRKEEERENEKHKSFLQGRMSVFAQLGKSYRATLAIPNKLESNRKSQFVGLGRSTRFASNLQGGFEGGDARISEIRQPCVMRQTSVRLGWGQIDSHVLNDGDNVGTILNDSNNEHRDSMSPSYAHGNVMKTLDKKASSGMIIEEGDEEEEMD